MVSENPDTSSDNKLPKKDSKKPVKDNLGNLLSGEGKIPFETREKGEIMSILGEYQEFLEDIFDEEDDTVSELKESLTLESYLSSRKGESINKFIKLNTEIIDFFDAYFINALIKQKGQVDSKEFQNFYKRYLSLLEVAQDLSLRRWSDDTGIIEGYFKEQGLFVHQLKYHIFEEHLNSKHLIMIGYILQNIDFPITDYFLTSLYKLFQGVQEGRISEKNLVEYIEHIFQVFKLESMDDIEDLKNFMFKEQHVIPWVCNDIGNLVQGGEKYEVSLAQLVEQAETFEVLIDIIEYRILPYQQGEDNVFSKIDSGAYADLEEIHWSDQILYLLKIKNILKLQNNGNNLKRIKNILKNVADTYGIDEKVREFIHDAGYKNIYETPDNDI